MSIKCFVLMFLSCFRMSILKSPHKNYCFAMGVIFKDSFYIFTKCINIISWFTINTAYYYIFLFGMVNSTVTQTNN